MFSAGIYRLMAGEADEQTPHHEDEIYYVLSGRADRGRRRAPAC
jgi:mannose-6-phosphate isomerase-like protein (cupin superfamily)